jgi:hypothetical protein
MEKETTDLIAIIAGLVGIGGGIFMTVIKIQIAAMFKKFETLWDTQIGQTKDIKQNTKEIGLLWAKTNAHEKHLAKHDNELNSIKTMHDITHPDKPIPSYD